MTNKSILIRIDDRVRLMSAVLAVTDWPDKAQQRKGHRPHAHARKTSKEIAEFKNHPAVLAAQKLLDQNAPAEALYTYALKLSFPDMHIENPPGWVPPNWNEYLRDFYVTAPVQNLWDQDAGDWEQAKTEVDSVLQNADYYDFLEPFFGTVQEQLAYMPNISYPSDMAVGARVGSELLCVGPPRIAWGDNPPWPFDEDHAHIYSTSLAEYVRLLMLSYLRQHADVVAPVTKKSLPVEDSFKAKHPAWGDQFTELFVPGCVALFLEKKVNPQEAKSFILMEKKIRGVTILPGVISVLQRYLNEYEDGKYSTFTDFLPLFPGHLRVAKTISAI